MNRGFPSTGSWLIVVVMIATAIGVSGCGYNPSSLSAPEGPINNAEQPAGRPSERSKPGAEGASRWLPAPGLTWQWQMTGDIDTSVDAEVFELDIDAPTEVLDELRGDGRRLICYVSTGSWEQWRPDADIFDASLLGAQLAGYPDERWLDIRERGALRPIMVARFDRCAQRGFDAVEADNVDGYANDSGFDLTGEDQLAYNQMLADLAHQRGLSIGLKNDVEQIPDLVENFDFAVNEECFTYDECDAYRVFVDAGKAVFQTEYDPDAWDPAAARRIGMSSILKHRELDAWRVA